MFGKFRFLVLAVIFQPVLPFAAAFIVAAKRHIQRPVIAGHPLVHRDDFVFADIKLGGNLRDLFWFQVAIINSLDLPLDSAQVEKQLFLTGCGTDFDKRPRPQNIFLNGGFNPPHGVSGQTKAFFWLKFFHRMHHAKITLRDQIGNRQAIAAISHGNFCHKPQMAGDQLVRGGDIAFVFPCFRQHIFLARFQHRKRTDLVQIAR